MIAPLIGHGLADISVAGLEAQGITRQTCRETEPVTPTENDYLGHQHSFGYHVYAKSECQHALCREIGKRAHAARACDMLRRVTEYDLK